MAGNMGFDYFVRTLLYQLPLLLVFMVGFIVALLRWNRHRAASLLVVLGSSVSLSVMMGASVVVGMLLEARVNNPVGNETDWLLVVNIIGSIGRGVGMALLVAAIFVGRRRAGNGRTANEMDYGER